MKVWYRADNPEKNRIMVWKSVQRKIRQGNGYEYILWRGYKWVVWQPSNVTNRYEIKYQLGRK